MSPEWFNGRNLLKTNWLNHKTTQSVKQRDLVQEIMKLQNIIKKLMLNLQVFLPQEFRGQVLVPHKPILGKGHIRHFQELGIKE